MLATNEELMYFDVFCYNKSFQHSDSRAQCCVGDSLQPSPHNSGLLGPQHGPGLPEGHQPPVATNTHCSSLTPKLTDSLQ